MTGSYQADSTQGKENKPFRGDTKISVTTSLLESVRCSDGRKNNLIIHIGNPAFIFQNK